MAGWALRTSRVVTCCAGVDGMLALLGEGQLAPLEIGASRVPPVKGLPARVRIHAASSEGAAAGGVSLKLGLMTQHNQPRRAGRLSCTHVEPQLRQTCLGGTGV